MFLSLLLLRFSAFGMASLVDVRIVILLLIVLPSGVASASRSSAAVLTLSLATAGVGDHASGDVHRLLRNRCVRSLPVHTCFCALRYSFCVLYSCLCLSAC